MQREQTQHFCSGFFLHDNNGLAHLYPQTQKQVPECKHNLFFCSAYQPSAEPVTAVMTLVHFTHMLYVCLYSALRRKMSYAKLHGVCSCSILLSWYVLTPLTTGLPCMIFYPTVFDCLNANIFYRHKGKNFHFQQLAFFCSIGYFIAQQQSQCFIYVYMRRIKRTLDLIKYEGKTVQGCSHGAQLKVKLLVCKDIYCMSVTCQNLSVFRHIIVFTFS